MDTSELLRIARSEGLEMPVLHGAGDRRNEAVVLEHDGDVFTVFLANERGGMIASTLRTFGSESDALEHVLLKLRQSEKARRAMDELRARRAGEADLSEAIVLYLKNYPRENEEEFRARFDTEKVHDSVRAILDETMSIQVDWAGKSLVDLGDEVRTVMRERHPELSDAALRKLGNYFTYLVK